MKTRNDFAFEFQKQLAPMVEEQVLSSQAAHLLTQMVGDMLVQYSNALTEQFAQRYRDWESRVGEDTTTLYSLGLRHATDIVLEIDGISEAKKTADAYLRELEELKEAEENNEI
jgi:hypothetical protein